jgi:hypothetical protein
MKVDPLSAAIVRQMAGMPGATEEKWNDPLQMPVTAQQAHSMGDLRPQPGEPPIGPVAPMGAAINWRGQMSNMPIVTGGGEWAALPNFGIGHD